MGPVSRPARRPEEDSTDVDLVHRVRAGDRGAVDDLYQRFRRPAFALARQVLADDGHAEDVLRDVFVGIWRDPTAFDRRRGSVASELLAMVHHRAVDVVRREESQRRRRTPAADDLPAGTPAPARGVLPSLQREALALAYYGGYTQREVAALTGAPLGTVKTRMLAGMRRLREELDAGSRPLGGALGGAAVDGSAR